MSIKLVQLKDNDGNNIYPITSTDCILPSSNFPGAVFLDWGGNVFDVIAAKPLIDDQGYTEAIVIPKPNGVPKG